jgi:predicted DCC family thiol-disulfide oxidoreductase YuxK
MPSDDKSAVSVTVYYNSACPVCEAGIRSQRARMQGCEVEWIDVHSRPEVARELGIGLEDLRERLHVRDGFGRMEIGDRAFAALWARTPGQRWLSWIPRLLGWLTGPLYKLFARLLYRWNRRRGHW